MISTTTSGQFKDALKIIKMATEDICRGLEWNRLKDSAKILKARYIDLQKKTTEVLVADNLKEEEDGNMSHNKRKLV